MNQKRGQVWISAVLYVLVVVSVMVIILSVGVPVINKLKDKAAFNNLKNNAQVLDSYIKDVVSEGPGSQRVVSLPMSGRLFVQNNKLIWQIPLHSLVMAPRSKLSYGDVEFLSLPYNSTVTAYESPDYCYYILDNGFLRVNLTEFGNISKPKENCSTVINTSRIINSIYSEKEGKYIDANFSIHLSTDESSSYGTGYSVLSNSGDFLSSAYVLYFVNSSNYDYSFYVGLDSSSDFVSVKLNSFTSKI